LRSTDVAFWALGVLERVTGGTPNEDIRVELKKEWPEPRKAARRLAGHANAMHGERILWLIGVDEKTGTVTGAPKHDVAAWWSQVQSNFDEDVWPNPYDTHVTFNELSVAAWAFETDAAPYVIRVPEECSVTREVPWRDGTRVRSARRTEVLRAMLPADRAPHFQVLKGHMHLTRGNVCEVDMTFYIMPHPNDVIFIPKFHIRADVAFAEGENPVDLIIRHIDPPRDVHFPLGREIERSPGSLTIQGTGNELLIGGPGVLHFRAECSLNDCGRMPGTHPVVRLTMWPAYGRNPIRGVFHFRNGSVENDNLTTWSAAVWEPDLDSPLSSPVT
jgi:hypothetical protein